MATSRVTESHLRIFARSAESSLRPMVQSLMLKEYQSVMEDSGTPPDVKNAVAALIARQREHIGQLDPLVDAP